MSDWSSKYRPKDLESYVGNKLIINELKTLNKLGETPQTIMLSGASGCGKTTLAYLIAKMNSCEHILSDGSPCNNCRTCQEIDSMLIEKGKNPFLADVKAYNISKLNKAEDAEAIIDEMSNAYTLPNMKRYYILDEIQVASQQAQARFLKITEEKPKGVYIIICTTNPEKLSEPLLNRFVKYNLKKPTLKEITDRLINICQEENLRYSQEALKMIVTYSKYSLRASISKLQELSAYKDIVKETVSKNLGIASFKEVDDYLSFCKQNNLVSIIDFYNNLDAFNMTGENFVKYLGDFLIDSIEIANNLESDIYSASEIKTYKEFINGLGNPLIVDVLNIVFKYTKQNRVEDRMFFVGFSTEMMSLMNAHIAKDINVDKAQVLENVVQSEMPEITSEGFKNKYKEVSNKIGEKPSADVVQDEATVDFMTSLFQNSAEVIL